LNQVDLLGGKVTAVTTDGFVCDIENLEEKLIQRLYPNSFLLDYQEIRDILSKNRESLEIKTTVDGIMQWSTRGQLSIDNSNSIAAMTGYQKYHLKHQENVQKVSAVIGNGNKISYLQTRLTGALDNYQNGSLIFKEGPGVSMNSTLSNFKTIFDTRRVIIPEEEGMNFTIPFNTVNECSLNRLLIKNSANPVYSEKMSHLNKISLVSKNSIDAAILQFLFTFLFYNNNPTPKELKIIYNFVKDAIVMSGNTVKV